MRGFHLSFAFVIALVGFNACSHAETAQVILYGGTNEAVLAACNPFYECERPRLNDLGEVVWAQRISADSSTYGIYTNHRGVIASGFRFGEPDINNLGEVIWRFGDGGRGVNGIESSVRGLIYSSSGQDKTHTTKQAESIILAKSWPRSAAVAPRSGLVAGGLCPPSARLRGKLR